MEDRIICLVGASGTGKTTIAKELDKIGMNIIHSYTTRPPREENEWGHNFIKNAEIMKAEDEVKAILSNSVTYHRQDMIALKEIYENFYFATKKQYQNKGTSIYVVCPEGANQVKESVSDAEVITLFLQCDEIERRDRMHYAGRKKEDIANRIERDKELFKICKCDYVVNANEEIEDTVNEIKAILTNHKSEIKENTRIKTAIKNFLAGYSNDK